MHVIIVGLPLFAERLAKSLSEFDPDNRYTFLNTYYSRKDKLKARFMIPRADLLFSINGTVLPSGVMDLAIKKKVPIVMNWVGTDVTLAQEAITKGNFVKEYIDYPVHFCEVNWIQDELQSIGIKADIVNFASFDKQYAAQTPVQDKLTVLTYIPKVRSDFYGIQMYLNIAKKFPQLQFLIAGTEAKEYESLPENVEALGWVKNMDSLYERVHVCVRIPEHDGLSTFILEALARAKDVIYKYAFEHCLQASNEEELEQRLLDINNRFIAGKWTPNEKGASFIATEFSKEKILNELIDRIKVISK